jgi:hypothetical protein
VEPADNPPPPGGILLLTPGGPALLGSALPPTLLPSPLPPLFGSSFESYLSSYTGLFTKALSYTISFIRVNWSVRVVAHMDDSLLLHQSKDHLQLAILQIGFYLQSQGWTLSLAKCEVSPSRQTVFLD